MYDKNEDKNQRVPIEGKTNEDSKTVRLSTKRGLKLDSAYYEKQHPDKKFMKVTDLNDDVQWWLDRGAEPVQRMGQKRRTYHGINDKQESEYVSYHGGFIEGTAYKVWLLMISPEDYEHYKIGPQKQRQQDIQDAMRMAKDPEGTAQTYAANLPDGSGTGFNQIKTPQSG